jgi:hypothetical protein
MKKTKIKKIYIKAHFLKINLPPTILPYVPLKEIYPLTFQKFYFYINFTKL